MKEEEEIKELQDTVRKLDERLAKLERGFGVEQAAREATAVNKARKASEASIRNLEKE